ncbi:MAG: DNA primase [Candidatus Omnitrophica bacterium]|nr:DNA primase [Candidatus Omnitrophota bacterium]
MIPPAAVRDLQDRLSIVDVVGGYISLKKAGRNFKALCPFHPEKTPSFMIYPEKQFFICYGCGVGGDAIAFVMKHEKVEFAEAVELLAQKAGVEMPRASGGRPAKEDREMYRAHEVAARFYRECLASEEGEAARAYLKKRGLPAAAWETFSIGCAPRRWDGLLTAAGKEGLPPAVLERAGLAIPRDEKQGWYDRFRGRVIFPIADSRGRVIAFGGRTLEEDGPKYLNSPETELYIKGKVLYGLHLAAPEIRQKDFCIVVEGYMDMVMPFQHGFRNVVASMGTSLTDQQVRLIRRNTRNVVMVYDGDAAGESATLRGLDLLLEQEMRVRVAVLPGGSDPDSLIREQGPEKFAQALKQSQELFDYKLGRMTGKFNPAEVEGRVRICQEMLPTIKRVPNAIQRGEYVKRLAEALGISEQLLWTEMGRVKANAPWKPEGIAKAGAPPALPAMTAEDLLVGLLLEDPRRVEQVAGRLDPEKIRDPEVRQVVSRLIERWNEGASGSDHRELLEAGPRGSGEPENRVYRWLAWADSMQEKERALDEVLERIQESGARARRERIMARLKEVRELGDAEEEARLISELNQLIKNRNAPKQAAI